MGSADGASAESLGGLGESGVTSHGTEVPSNVDFQTSRSDLSVGGSCASTDAHSSHIPNIGSVTSSPFTTVFGLTTGAPMLTDTTVGGQFSGLPPTFQLGRPLAESGLAQVPAPELVSGSGTPVPPRYTEPSSVRTMFSQGGHPSSQDTRGGFWYGKNPIPNPIRPGVPSRVMSPGVHPVSRVIPPQSTYQSAGEELYRSSWASASPSFGARYACPARPIRLRNWRFSALRSRGY